MFISRFVADPSITNTKPSKYLLQFQQTFITQMLAHSIGKLFALINHQGQVVLFIQV